MNITMKRNRSKPHSFEGQLAAEKARLEAELAKTPRGPAREALAQKIRQIETAVHMNDLLSSGLRSQQ